MARESLIATEDPPELRHRLELLQRDFDAFKQDAEALEKDLEVELRFTKEHLEEITIDNEELRTHLQLLDEKSKEQDNEIRYLQEQLEVIIGEKAELKRAVEQAEQRLLFAPISTPNDKGGNVLAMDPTPLKMVMDMKQRVQSLEDKLARAKISLAPLFKATQ